jgi:hypothetical protein
MSPVRPCPTRRPRSPLSTLLSDSSWRSIHHRVRRNTAEPGQEARRSVAVGVWVKSDLIRRRTRSCLARILRQLEIGTHDFSESRFTEVEKSKCPKLDLSDNNTKRRLVFRKESWASRSACKGISRRCRCSCQKCSLFLGFERSRRLLASKRLRVRRTRHRFLPLHPSPSGCRRERMYRSR